MGGSTIFGPNQSPQAILRQALRNKHREINQRKRLLVGMASGTWIDVATDRPSLAITMLLAAEKMAAPRAMSAPMKLSLSPAELSTSKIDSVQLTTTVCVRMIALENFASKSSGSGCLVPNQISAQFYLRRSPF